ncbi:MAG: N-acetylmuramic acid 6-phosphate etherase [Candidatus Coatesbacteria bacterium]
MIYAGIDAGGTKVRVAVADGRGRLVAHREGPGANALTDGPDAAVERIVDALSGLRPDAIAVGLAGAWSLLVSRRVTTGLRAALGTRRVVVRNDAVAVLEALAPREPAVLVAAGTGTVTIGRAASGRVVRVDGWGPVLGDEGSGLWIGRRAVEHALRAHDGRARPSTFARAILRAAGLANPERDIRRLYAPGFRPQALARFVPLVAGFARRGDPDARRIMQEAGRLLTESALVARRKLGGRGRVRLFATGGLTGVVPLRPGRAFVLDRRRIIPEAAALRLAARAFGGAATERLLEPAITRLDRSRPRRVRDGFASIPATERANPLTAGFSRMTVLEMVRAMNREDARVASAIARILPAVARAVTLAERSLRRGGRMIYVGAGTSGRLGVLDASEVPPTFGVKPGVVVGVMAGGRRALDSSIEGAEDNAEAGVSAMRRIRVGRRDFVVGLSVSGGAPFVLAAVREARRRGAATAAITVNAASPLARAVHVPLVPAVGPEVVAGSSRLKAGTAQKMLLNMLSTCVFALLGRVRGNLMSHVKPVNEKLRGRAVRIAARLLSVPAAEAEARLKRSGWRLDAVLDRVVGS